MFIPDKLYHATIKSRIRKIKEFGLGGKIPRNRFWDYKDTDYENITIGCFFDSDMNCAYDYVEASEYFDGDEDDIVVFEVNTSDLDLTKLSYDRNDEKNINDESDESHSYFYNGIVPYEKLRKLNYSELFEMKHDDLYNAIMEKLSVIVKQALNEDSDDLTPGEKMDAWHNGERKENIKACDADKLKKYKAICKAKGYDAEVAAIQAEIDKRGLKESVLFPEFEETFSLFKQTLTDNGCVLKGTAEWFHITPKGEEYPCISGTVRLGQYFSFEGNRGRTLAVTKFDDPDETGIDIYEEIPMESIDFERDNAGYVIITPKNATIIANILIDIKNSLEDSSYITESYNNLRPEIVPLYDMLKKYNRTELNYFGELNLNGENVIIEYFKYDRYNDSYVFRYTNSEGDADYYDINDLQQTEASDLLMLLKEKFRPLMNESMNESINPEQYLENMDYLIDTYNSEYENDFDAECDYNDFLSHLNYIEEHSDATSYLIIGNLGLWNGRPNIYPVLKQYLKDAYKKCVNNMDDVIVKINDTVMEVTGLHHDGRNTFYIVPLNEKGDEDYHNWDSSYDSILEYDDTLTLDKIIAAGLNAQFVW